ncbi:hypothetical protein [Blastococcus sp. SYSU D00695]
MTTSVSARRVRTAVAGLAATSVLAACTTTVDGTVAGRSDGPLTQVLGQLDLAAVVGTGAVPIDLAAAPDGHLTALVRPAGPTGGVDTVLVDLLPGADGPEAGPVRELPALDRSAELHVAPDGTAVVAGVLQQGTERGPRILVLEPGAGEPEFAAWGMPTDELESALSPDGTYLYVNATPTTRPQESRLFAVRVLSRGRTDWFALPPGSRARDLAVTPDGTVTALVEVAAPDGTAPLRLATFDAALRPRTDTALPPADLGAALAVTPDGVAVVSVGTGPPERATVLRVVDGRPTEIATLDDAGRAPRAAAVDPAGRYAYLPYVTADGDAVVAVVALATGEVTDVDLCADSAGFDVLTLAADGATLTLLGSCGSGRPLAVLLGRG